MRSEQSQISTVQKQTREWLLSVYKSSLCIQKGLNKVEKTSSYMSQTANKHHQVIDLDSKEDSPVLSAAGNYYFGSFELTLNAEGQLKVVFKFKHNLVSPQLEEQQIATIEIQEYQMSRIELNLTDKELTSSLKQSFGNVAKLATFLAENIADPQAVVIDKEKLTLHQKNTPAAELYFSNYKKYDKMQLLKEMQRFEEATAQETWNSVGQDDIEKVLDQEYLLQMALEGDEDSSDEDSSEEGKELMNIQHEEAQFPNAGPQLAEHQNQDLSEADSYQAPNINYQIFKQNQVPIYERFRNVNIHCSRKEKMRLSEQMLRIGYPKEDIIKFFSGGAEEMEAEARRVPDYRNPETERYKQIHMLVAKKQHKRHNELLKKHGMLPVPELPQYSGQVVPTIRQEVCVEKKIKEVLVRMIKGKKFRRLDEIHLQMSRNGVETTLPYLRKLVEEMKQKSHERKKTKAKNQVKQVKEISIDD